MTFNYSEVWNEIYLLSLFKWKRQIAVTWIFYKIVITENEKNGWNAFLFTWFFYVLIDINYIFFDVEMSWYMHLYCTVTKLSIAIEDIAKPGSGYLPFDYSKTSVVSRYQDIEIWCWIVLNTKSLDSHQRHWIALPFYSHA